MGGLFQFRPVGFVGLYQVIENGLGHRCTGHCLGEGDGLPQFLVRVLNPGFDHQFLDRDLLAHHALLEQRDAAHLQRLWSAAADQAGDLDHGFRVKVGDGAAIGNDQQHPLLGVEGDGGCQVNDIGGVFIDLQLARC